MDMVVLDITILITILHLCKVTRIKYMKNKNSTINYHFYQTTKKVFIGIRTMLTGISLGWTEGKQISYQFFSISTNFVTIIETASSHKSGWLSSWFIWVYWFSIGSNKLWPHVVSERLGFFQHSTCCWWQLCVIYRINVNKIATQSSATATIASTTYTTSLIEKYKMNIKLCRKLDMKLSINNEIWDKSTNPKH